MDADLTIIGAGVVGLAIAAELADRNRTIYIVEKNETHGRGTSSRNSEVIHAGIYYPADSLKAKLCIEGRAKIYETCEKNNIPHHKVGKLIIAVTEDETGTLEQLMRKGIENGVSSLRLLAGKHVHELEPNIKAVAALLSPETGIVSVHALMDHYLRRAREQGAEIVYGTEVSGIERVSNAYKITTVDRSGDRFEFLSETVVNSAGLASDTIASLTGKRYQLHYCKGDYFSINGVKKDTVKRLVYPVPEKNHAGLGVHLTMDLSGRLKLGPDVTYIERVEEYRVDASKRDSFYESAVRFLPFLRKEDIVPEMSGIRPKLQGPGEEFRDFVISEDLPGFVNLVGIESPGLTAAPAIAKYVRGLLHGGGTLAD